MKDQEKENDKKNNKKNSTVDYPHPAGGWGALKSSVKHIIQSEDAAKGIKTLLKANQPGGFDCPGCAWGEEKKSGSVDFCENGVKAIAWEVTAKRANRQFFADHSLTELKGWSDHQLEKSGRLTEPMLYDGQEDHYCPIGWDKANAIIAEHLQALESPDQALFYTSGRASNEAAYLYQLFGRSFGTNNFPDCSNMCHEASGVGMTQSIGTGKGTVTMDDFEQAQAIFVFGQNPGTNHPRMLGTLRKAAKRGCRIVAINNLKERGLQRFSDPQSPAEMLIGSSTTISQDYITPKLGGDMALVRAIAKLMFEQEAQQPGIIDHDFIKQHSVGFNVYREAVQKTQWPELLEQSGVSLEEVQRLTDIYCASERTIFTWAMGITQHEHSVDTVRELVNLLLLKGNIGKAGAGACPVRGHSNVQGNRTVGIDEKPPAPFLDALELQYGFPMPRNAGFNTVQAIDAMANDKAHVFIALGGNFAVATPDTPYTQQAMSRCKLTVQISTKLNRSHLVTGQTALILPCLGRTEIDTQNSGEQIISVEDSMSMVHSSQGSNPPAAPALRSETAIVAGMAAATLGSARSNSHDRDNTSTNANTSEKKHTNNGSIDWLALCGDYRRIREHISRVLPGFSDFNQRLTQPGGFYLQNSAAQRQWKTPSERAHFAPSTLPISVSKYRANERHAHYFTLQTLRSHDQYNTTIYGMHDRYRGVHNERDVVFMNPADIEQLGLEAGDRIDLTTVSQSQHAPLRKLHGFKLIAYQIPSGSIAAYYPETNPLVPLSSVADGCGTPTYKSIPITVSKASAR